MNALLSQLIISTTLLWDYNYSDPNSGKGFKIHEQSLLGPLVTDVGNVLQFKLPGPKPGITYTWYVTAYNGSDESEPSNTIIWAEPIPAIHLEMASAGTLIAHVFSGGTFQLEVSHDLKTWISGQIFIADSDRQKLSVPSELALSFFRLKYLIPTPITLPAQTLVLNSMPPMPILPPKKVKLTFRQKLKLFFKYRPGNHPDSHKGAQILTNRK